MRKFLPCRSRNCASAWCRRQWQNLHADRIGGWAGTFPKLSVAVMTLTPPGHVEDVGEWNATAAHRFNRLVRDLRAGIVAGPAGAGATGRAEFVRVAEMQERGLVHFHVLWVDWGWADMEAVRALAERHGFGRMLELKRPRVSVRGVAGYYVKRYITKGGGVLPGGMRAIVYSQGWPKVYRPPSVDPVVVTLRSFVSITVRPGAVWRESWSEWADRQDARHGSQVAYERGGGVNARPKGDGPPARVALTPDVASQPVPWPGGVGPPPGLTDARALVA